MQSPLSTLAPLAIVGSLLVACAADSVDTTPGSGNTAGSSSSGANQAGSAPSSGAGSASGGSGSVPSAGSGNVPSAGSSGSSAGSAAGGSSGQKPLALPFYVNAPGNFVKSGFIGDAATSVTAAPSAADKDGTCGAMRAPGMAGGDCDTFNLTPAADGAGWQGVFYQFPSGNWGALPGRSISPGAKQVSFSVRASREVAVKFQVGLCDPEKATDPTACVDGFFAFADDADAADKVTVTSEWTEHSVSLADVDYAKGVRGAFSWVIVNDDLLGDSSALSLYIDALRWE